METLVILCTGTVAVIRSPGYASHHLSNDDKVDYQWRSQERVFTDVEQADGLVATHEDLSVVLIKRTLVIAHCWHVLDDHAMIWMLVGLIEDLVCFHHVIHNISLRDLFGLELFVRAEVLAVIVTKMIVARDGGELETGIDHKVRQGRLHLCLAGFEVIATNEGVVLFRKLNCSWYEGVLRRAIDKWSILEDASNSKDS